MNQKLSKTRKTQTIIIHQLISWNEVYFMTIIIIISISWKISNSYRFTKHNKVGCKNSPENITSENTLINNDNIFRYSCATYGI